MREDTEKAVATMTSKPHSQLGNKRNETHYDFINKFLKSRKPLAPVKPLSISQQFQMTQLGRLQLTPTWESPKIE
jgi:hypothetical protein